MDTLDEEFDDLGIEIDNIVHVLLIGHTELIGEHIIDKATKDYIFYNPIKILRDSFFDEEGTYNNHSYLIEWNPCIENDFILIKPSSVISISKPNKFILKSYLDCIKELYYNDDSDSLMNNNTSSIKPSKDNIIVFPKRP